ncbi:PIR Superfamily Protein [Plasmodium ovale curtisi]|uniref:PIR Superfamily Protein n=1 Tax=Plasmodium ovale curtisi TaxID=864141 RepID=A0A1A8VUP0_PLAOA|nr:PIR Superfamily Protein [Plasmodium ovale curtisi]SBT00672.1 PIR Superfamily Protein [Plasmodium ovale curtisi]
MEEDLKYQHLSSYKFYKQLNDEVDENQKGDTCWNKIDYILKKHPTVRKICNKLKRNLQLIENENTSFTFNRKHCYDLNYWLYYVVSNDLKINDNDSDFYEIIDRLQDVCFKSHATVFLDAEILPKITEIRERHRIVKHKIIVEQTTNLTTDKQPSNTSLITIINGLNSFITGNGSSLLLIAFDIFMIFFFYKFTPLGRSMLLAREQIRKHFRSKIFYEDIKLLHDSSNSS